MLRGNMPYGFFADLIVAFHVAYILFILLGQIAICIGWALSWRWIRNPWFRSIHLVAICLVGLEALFAIDCPLTIWENQLRELAGQPVSDASFIGRCLHDLIFYDVENQSLNWIHMGFALLVLATLVLIPPRRRQKQASIQAN